MPDSDLKPANLYMICTNAPGGMRSVVEGYRADGVFERWGGRLLTPHTHGSRWRRLVMAASCLASFVAALLRGRVGLVHCHAAMRGSFWRKSVFALLARARGLPVVFHLHGSEMKVFVEAQPGWVQRLIAWVLSQQTVVLVLSQSWFDYVTALAPKAQVRILPNYVKMPEERSLDAPLAQTVADPQRLTLLFLGLVGDRKGVFDLLPAFKQAWLRHPQLHLMLGGNGETARAQAEVNALGLQDAITVLGWVDGAQKAALLRSADVYVLPSHNEGLPMSLLEAMSHGLPVISTTVGGIPELVRHEQDGLLIEPGNVSALAAAIEGLAADPRRRSVMGASGRARVAQSFSKESVLPQLEALYTTLLNQR